MRLQRKSMRPERLRHVYGLTDAEAALALGLADGRSLNDYALLHGLSRNYTRWLSKVIFTAPEPKTGMPFTNKLQNKGFSIG